MEVRCPQCTQRLRYSDVLKNPLLRCRACGTTFRPNDVVQEVAYVAEAIEEAPRFDRRYRPAVESNPEPVPVEIPRRGANAAGKGGLGTLAVIVLVILVKVGPRLAQELFRDKPRKQPPAHFQEHRQKAMENLARKAAEAQARREGLPVRVRGDVDN